MPDASPPVVPAPPAPPGSHAPRWGGALALLARDIKLAHSVFALPFALLAAFLAGPFPGADASQVRRFAGSLALVVVCMVTARTWAMLVNRLADRAIDARNARTARRVLASGAVTPAQGWLVALASAALFVAATSLFLVLRDNPYPLILSVPVLAFLAFYSYTKRFTWFCHLVLGAALALSPIAAAIALRPEQLGENPAVLLLAAFVLLWVAGFDVIYALQDQAFDRQQGLSSIPARLGTRAGVWITRGAHALALACLLGAQAVEPRFGWLMLAGVALVAGLLLWEHAILTRLARAHERDQTLPAPALSMAFFTLNGVVSCVLGVVGIADVLIDAR